MSRPLLLLALGAAVFACSKPKSASTGEDTSAEAGAGDVAVADAPPPPKAIIVEPSNEPGGPGLKLSPAPATADPEARAVALRALFERASELEERATEPGTPFTAFPNTTTTTTTTNVAPLSLREVGIEHKGDLAEEVIRRVIRRQFAELRACGKPGGPSGRVGTFSFTVQPEGSVRAVRTDAALAIDFEPACVLRVVYALDFPRPADGKSVEVSYKLQAIPPL